MNISQIKIFITAAKYLNFSKAADQLDMSQPTLSKQISRIESELNLMLFIRSGRKLSLTPAGKNLYQKLSDVYTNYQMAVSQAQQIQKGLSSDLKIGVLHGTNVSDFMPKICSYFDQHYPNVELSFSYSSFHTLQEQLYNNEIDIAFMVQFYAENKEYLLYKYVEHTHDFLLMSKDHPLAKRKTLSLKDCKDETFILISDEDCPESSNLIIQECIRQGFYPKVTYAKTLYDLMLATEVGQGVTILDTRNMLQQDPCIKAFPLLGMPWDPSLVAVWNQENYNPSIPIFMARLDAIMQKQK